MIVGLSRATTRKEAPAMAGADRMTIEEVVKGVMVQEHGDLVRAAVEAVCAELMEGEVAALIGAELGERRPEDRMTHRNGYRARECQTGRARSSCGFPSCVAGRTSRAFSSRAG